MPLGLPIGPPPLTSTLVIGSLDILLHRGGAAETTIGETVAHSYLEQAMWLILETNLRTQCMWVSAEICSLNVYGLVGFLRP